MSPDNLERAAFLSNELSTTGLNHENAYDVVHMLYELQHSLIDYDFSTFLYPLNAPFGEVLRRGSSPVGGTPDWRETVQQVGDLRAAGREILSWLKKLDENVT